MELLCDRYPAEDALAGRRCSRRRQVGQVEVGDVAGSYDAAEYGDSQRSADLVDGLQHSRADSALLGGQFDERGGSRGGEGEAHPGSDDHHPHGDEDTARVDARRSANDQSRGEQGEASGDGDLGPDELCDHRGRDRSDQHARRPAATAAAPIPWQCCRARLGSTGAW